MQILRNSKKKEKKTQPKTKKGEKTCSDKIYSPSTFTKTSGGLAGPQI